MSLRPFLRVAMIIQAYLPRLGGAERQLAALSPLLQQSGIDVHILTRRYSGLSAFEVIAGVPVHRLPIPGPKPLAALTFTASALPVLKSIRPHIIHAYELLSPATTALVAKRLFGTPVVAKVLRGGLLGDLAKLKRRRLGQRRIAALTRHIDSFVVISREIDQELAEVGVPASKRVFIPNGVNLERFAPATPQEKVALRQKLRLPHGPLAIYTGRLETEKRVNLLIDLWPQVRAAFADATLLILGEGAEEPALRSSAGAQVIFGGNVEDTAPYLRTADVFALPSVTEGLSNALLEAMAAGTPAIATAVGGAPDLIRHDQNAWLIPPDDPPALLNALLTLLGDPELRARLGDCGRDGVQQGYSLESVANQLGALYRRLASN